MALLPCGAIAKPTEERSNTLRFEIAEGRNLNAFYRKGPVAAHLLLRSGADPRILVAFPAGNSGVGLWFGRQDQPARWKLEAPLAPIEESDASGRTLRGIEAEVLVNASSLTVSQALLSSVRVLRDYETAGTVPGQVTVRPMLAANRISWARDRLDGAAGYKLSVEVLQGRLEAGVAAVEIRAQGGAPIRLKIRAFTGEVPLTPLEGSELLSANAAKDDRARDALTFLSYREKFLAGSWRFNTYFGRDTLMSLRLLMPVLKSAAIESGLLSVLERLAPNGEVAHEEDVGEFSVLRHLAETGSPSSRPIYDYGMIDDDFMLSPVIAAYLLEGSVGRLAAAALLCRDIGEGVAAGDALVRNLIWLAAKARAFGADPRAGNLIALKPGRAAGQWRDSQEGLGRGRYPYDINVALVPAALDAGDRLVRSGLLDPYLSDEERVELSHLGGDAAIWAANAPGFFRVRIPAAKARQAIQSYADDQGVGGMSALSELGERGIEFDALALDSEARAVPVIHSDPGFSLLFGNPSARAVERSLTAMMRPFPAGLMTEAGLLVANPVFADARTQSALNRNAYHGTVIWAWQQSLLIAGIDRQLKRNDLSASLKIRLRAARERLRAAMSDNAEVRTSELWSWVYVDGRYKVAPFGAETADEDESNAAQLWSTVVLSQ